MLYLLLAQLITLAAAYRNKIEPFSFDIRKFEYPLEYLKFGATVALRKHIKLLPRVKDRYGGLWLQQVSITKFLSTTTAFNGLIY